MYEADVSLQRVRDRVRQGANGGDSGVKLRERCKIRVEDLVGFLNSHGRGDPVA